MLHKVWVRVASFALLAVAAAVLARVLAPFLPDDLPLETGTEALENVLGILTSSMLAVTTFSLSIAVSAFAAAAATATPRATVLLQEDPTTQNVLATFLGAFLFGLVALIGLHANLYGDAGIVVVFLFAVVVIGLVVIALIRWIGHLMEFGRMADTLNRVEEAATDSLRARMKNPYLGGHPLTGVPPQTAVAITGADTGYVQHIDMQALQDCAEAHDLQFYLRCLPGTYVAADEPLISVSRAVTDEKQLKEIRLAVVVGTARTFRDDPRFGLIVMTEIASRALSPAVNDPGTAIEILGRLVRILRCWTPADGVSLTFDRVFVPTLTLQDLMEDTFRPIARDGAALSEVQIRLQKALVSLRAGAPEVFGDACARMAREAVNRAEAADLLPSELATIRAVAPGDAAV